MISRQIVTSPASLQNAQAGFLAQTVVVDNPTNQWYYEPNSHRFIPPFFGGVVIAIGGIQAISLMNQAPIGVSQPPSVAGQQLTATFTHAEFIDSPGIPLITPRTNFADRNPVFQLLEYHANGVAPTGATVRAAYTVPTGRRAQITSQTYSMVRDAVAAGPGPVKFYARVAGLDSNTIGGINDFNGAVGAGKAENGPGPNLYPGLLVELVTADSSANGTMSYLGSVTVQEYDA